jgi:hypothetical protein
MRTVKSLRYSFLKCNILKMKNMGMNPVIDECLQLLEKLETEFPDEPDLEALHSVTGIYAKLKKYRDRISEFPIHVRVFCEFIHVVRCPSAEIATFLDFMRNSPGAFSSAEGGTFLEKRQRIAAVAERAGLEPARLFHFISMARLKGLLNKKNELVEEFGSLIADYLGS